MTRQFDRIKLFKLVYLLLAVLSIALGLGGASRLLLALGQPTGGFFWFLDEAKGYIVRYQTGSGWPGSELTGESPQQDDRIVSVYVGDQEIPAREFDFGTFYRDKNPGDPVKYIVNHRGEEKEVVSKVTPFTWPILLETSLVIFLVGLGFWGLSLLVGWANFENEAARLYAFLVMLGSIPFFFNSSASAIHEPYSSVLLSAIAWKPILPLIGAVSFHFATVFPMRFEGRWGATRKWVYVVALASGGAYALTSLPPLYPLSPALYQLNLGWMILGMVAAVGIFGYIYTSAKSRIVRERALVLLIGFGLASISPAFFWLDYLVGNIGIPWNTPTFLELGVPLSVIFAMLKYRLFPVRPILYRVLSPLLAFLTYVLVYVVLLSGMVPINDLNRSSSVRLIMAGTVASVASFIVGGIVWYQSRQQFAPHLRSGEFKLKLPALLDHLCERLGIGLGYISVYNYDCDTWELGASRGLPSGGCEIGATSVMTEEIKQIGPHETVGEKGIRLLVPLNAASGQIGVIALGAKASGADYSQEDKRLLAYVAGQIVDNIESVELLGRLLADINQARKVSLEAHQVAGDLQRTLETGKVEIDERQVRKIRKDCAYPAALGKHPLARSAMVDQKVKDPSTADVMERGKALQAIVAEEIERLRPPSGEDCNSSQWRHYCILRDAYLQDRKNEDVWQDLAISERHFFNHLKEATRLLADMLNKREIEALGYPEQSRVQ